MYKNGYYYPTEVFDAFNRFDLTIEQIHAIMRDKNDNILKYHKGSCAVGNIFGSRGGGKTVGIAIKLIERYLDFGERCLITPRTLTVKKGCYVKKWWDKILYVGDPFLDDFVSKHEIDYTNDCMLVDGEILCYCEAISMSELVKNQGSFQRCTTLLVDEAVSDQEHSLYIDGEHIMMRLWKIFWTMARGWKFAPWESRMLFCNNVSTRDNWLFNDLRINEFFRDDSKFLIRDGLVVEKVTNVAVNKIIYDSVAGKVMGRSLAGKQYSEQAFENVFGDNKAFVKRIGLDFGNLKVQLIIESACLGVFEVGDSYHIARIEPDNRSDKICNNPMYHSEEIAYKPNGRWNQLLLQLYISDKLTFSDIETKGVFLNYINVM